MHAPSPLPPSLPAAASASAPGGAPAPAMVDQYSHKVVGAELGLGAFEQHLAAAGGTSGAPSAGNVFDSRTGLALRRWCAPLLGLEPDAPPVRYLARRRELGADNATRALLRGSGITTLLMDATPVPGLPDTAAVAPDDRIRELVRLDRLAAQVADTSGTVRGFLANIGDALHSAARGAPAFVCDARELQGTAGTAPGPAEAGLAAGNWLAGRTAAATAALPPAITLHLLWGALAAGRPVQLLCTDPAPLAGLLRATAGRGSLVLLPGRGHHRRAAALAAEFAHVYADAGPDPRETLGEAPFGKLLFSTGARLLPELHVVRARQFRQALARLLGEWAADDACTPADAARITTLVTTDNARRLYRLAPDGR
ncbi:amidohydrolase [Streptomyces sp. YIM 98790]|uniref:amidohydrolase n=1 Tax=Streptomyces sp. YIM 98790 TaxID=2689077 RepID=UPI001FB77713|nr:amidohydrolase [Streptomyces sp. YIM 98790]